jgi:hypothetical protein
MDGEQPPATAARSGWSALRRKSSRRLPDEAPAEASDTPLADNPLADNPLADKPSADKPSADKPSADKPSADMAVIDPEAGVLPRGGSAPAGPDRSRGRLGRVLRNVEPGVAIPVLIYLLFSFLGVTTSSLGAEMLRQDSANPQGMTIGLPQTIRSDEFLRITPIQLGVIAAGDSVVTPLSAESDTVTQIPDGELGETLVFFDTAVLRLGPLLPDAQLFAAVRWFPMLLFAVFCPLWLRRMGATTKTAWFATIIIGLSPTTVWWSFQSIIILGYVFAGLYLVIVAAERWRRSLRTTALLAAALGGLLLARMVTGYVPWSLTLGVPVVLATAVWLLWSKEDRRAGLISLAAGAASSVLFLGIVIVENLGGLQAQLSTVYPGQRRSTGMVSDPGRLFGAPVQFVLQTGEPLVSSTNLSEVSTGFTVAIVWAFILVAANRRLAGSRNAAAFVTLSVCTLAWLSWATLPWGDLGSKIPLFNLVAPVRVTGTVGIPAVLLLALALAQWKRPPRLTVPFVAAAITGWLTAYGAGALQWTVMPQLSIRDMVIAAIGTATVAFVVTAYPDHWWPYVGATVLAASVVYSVHPWIFGLGDLRTSPTAERMIAEGERARAAGELWASDRWFKDAMLNATGTPIIGGNQMAGPNREEWLKLDPTGASEQQWNRGSSVIMFSWLQGPDVSITSPNADVINVAIDPCTLQDRGFNVTRVISGRELTNSCLVPEPGLQWMSEQQFVYRVTPR